MYQILVPEFHSLVSIAQVIDLAFIDQEQDRKHHGIAHHEGKRDEDGEVGRCEGQGTLSLVALRLALYAR
jgi:hypothetical protein